MVPSLATKKSKVTSITHTTQAGCQQTQGKILKREELEDYDEGGADGESEESQKSVDGGIEQLMVRMVDDQRKRLAVRTKGVRDDYETSRKTALHSISSLFDKHEKSESSAHDTKLERLLELLARKDEIEVAMAQKLASLQSSHKAHSLDLEAVVEHKIKELK